MSARRSTADVAAATVLGLDTPEEAAEASARMGADRAFAHEMRRLERARAVLAGLPAEAWDRPTPPALAVERALAARPARGRSGRARRPAAFRLRPALAAGLAVVLLAVGVAAGLLLAPGEDSRSVPNGADGLVAAHMRVRLSALPGGVPASRGLVEMPVRAGGVASLSAHGLAPTGKSRYYEVWLMTDATRLVAIGTFRVGADGRAHVRFPVGVDPHGYRYVDVSLEPDDGNPGHSSDSVLRSAALS